MVVDDLDAKRFLALVDNVPGLFTDISSSGTKYHLNPGQTLAINTTIGNAVFPAGRLVIANSGGLGFDPPTDALPLLNEALPSPSAFGGGRALLAYWDDIGNTTGDVVYEQKIDRVVVQWQAKPLGSGSVTFQVQIPAVTLTPFPVYAQFLYSDITAGSGGAGATIGFQDGRGAALVWSLNTSGAVANGTVVSLVDAKLLVASATSASPP